MKIKIVLNNKRILGPFDMDVTEEEAMRIFNVQSLKDTYVDSNGMLELHNNQDVMIYTNLKVG